MGSGEDCAGGSEAGRGYRPACCSAQRTRCLICECNLRNSSTEQCSGATRRALPDRAAEEAAIGLQRSWLQVITDG